MTVVVRFQRLRFNFHKSSPSGSPPKLRLTRWFTAWQGSISRFCISRMRPYLVPNRESSTGRHSSCVSAELTTVLPVRSSTCPPWAVLSASKSRTRSPKWKKITLAPGLRFSQWPALKTRSERLQYRASHSLGTSQRLVSGQHFPADSCKC